MACVMVFDKKPLQFKTDHQRVSYAASFLSNIVLLWWQPHLLAQPEPSIRSNWAKFIANLDRYFGEPNLAQSSIGALHALKMQENHHINKYMIEFSEHASFMGWNDTTLYSEFYHGLAECIKNMLLHMEQALTLNQLKIDALKCVV